uniref:G-protein coupled receptors family 3 profile domain-containing protein n=1 Tax=Ditylum brightwellii TaxID=49249 RepID=A0A6U3T687_9STRA|mmetsp:Transcript_36137/g.53904  ORF Transcript_36137/g.53904 Transcript_36137/m.53904 type:complete len:760 (+) Transcript_36137:528-2807(+)
MMCLRLTLYPTLALLLRFLSAAEAQLQIELQIEVENRVRERIHEFMKGPTTINDLISELRTNGGFPHNMDARDRDAYLKLCFTIVKKFDVKVYYGLEDGTFLGYSAPFGTYREPGDGFRMQNVPAKYKKFLGTCVDPYNGTQKNCILEDGFDYIECIDDCVLEPCHGDADSWCLTYQHKKAISEDNLGFVPRTYYCIDEIGTFTEEQGAVISDVFDTSSRTTCYFGDNVTPVNRTISGDFLYCGGDGEICDGTFVGGYRSRNYDPRWRTWYKETKDYQNSMWSKPYPFFSTFEIGITYSTPFYSIEDDKKIFKGVLAVDYSFEDLRAFLKEAYSDKDGISVLICEESNPYYVIGSSTGTKAAKTVLLSDLLTPCKDSSSQKCTVVRSAPNDLSEHPMDITLARAHSSHKQEGFPSGTWISSKESDDFGSRAFISVSFVFEIPNENLRWRILTVMPTEKVAMDSVTTGSTLFVVLIAAGLLGALMCTALFLAYYRRRFNYAVMVSDWRFTSAFIIGCVALNGSTFFLLGESTDVMCMLRVWSFHYLIIATLSPLLVKVWRIYQLVGSSASRFRRHTISHTKLALYMLPFHVVQLLILTVFSVIDPPKAKEWIEISSNSHHITCGRNSNAFRITELIFEGSLVLIGCILAYKSRNLDPRFGETKQILFSIYNICFIGVLTVLVSNLTDLEEAQTFVLQAIAIFWATVISSCAFVLSRLIEIKRSNTFRSNTPTTNLQQNEISGDLSFRITPPQQSVVSEKL